MHKNKQLWKMLKEICLWAARQLAHRMESGFADHGAIPKVEEVNRVTQRKRLIGPRNRVKRKKWEPPSWIAELIESAKGVVDDLFLPRERRLAPRRHSVPRGSTKTKVLELAAIWRLQTRAHVSHTLSMYQVHGPPELCSSLMACTTCGAYAQSHMHALAMPCNELQPKLNQCSCNNYVTHAVASTSFAG
eukprot:300497-Amphidinium_carterae.1